MKKEINIYDGDEKYFLSVYEYRSNNNLYLGISDINNNIVQDISINISDIMQPNQIFLSNSLSKNTIAKLVKLDIISEPIKEVQHNLARYKLVNVDLDKIKEYDQASIEEYLNNHGNINNVDEQEVNNDFYTEQEVKKILDEKTKLVYVNIGNDEFVIKYEDLADVIVDMNDKLGFVNLKVYDYEKTDLFNPLLTTSGPFLNTCDPEVRKDIIDRLTSLQLDGEEIKDYKIINEDLLENIENSRNDELER